MIPSILSISLYMIVTMYMVSGQVNTSTMDNKMICDRTGECKYMVEEMKERWKKLYPLPRTYRTYIMLKLLEKPRWPFIAQRALQKSKRGTTWTRL